MAVVRFLQIADLHLGRPFGWLPNDRRDERRREQRRVLEDGVRQAIERGAHAILLPGDLFDARCVDADTLSFAVEAFAVPGCPPVFMSPGNHDPMSSSSHYWNAERLRARGRQWPAHVHVFDQPHWSGVPLAGQPGVEVWGRCFTDGVSSTDRPLAAAMLTAAHVPQDGLHVAVFHGSREGTCPPGMEMAAPFSDDEVRASPFAYHAVGHYHVPGTLEVDGRVRLAYSGSAAALDTTETGAHGALDVAIEWGEGGIRTTLKPVELDRRRVHEVSVDATGCATAEQLDRRVAGTLDAAGATEQDLATVRISGRLARGVRYSAAGPDLKRRAFHLRFDLSGLRPEHDLDAIRRGDSDATEERFARALLERIDATTDPTQRATLERALYYGLDAFRLGEVTPAYEELEA